MFLFLHTADFAADHERMVAAGVRFVEAPRHEPYGTVAVFEDRYGNRWDMIQRTPAPAPPALQTRPVPSFERPALVIVDVQRAIDDPRWGPRNNPAAEDRIADLLAAWRAKNLPRFHIRHDSTEPDSTYRPGQRGNEFKPQTAPQPGETVIAKRTNSAFVGTDLEDQLRATGADAVLYVGVITNNSVEATVRMSGNLGFVSYVVEDATATVDRIDRRGRHWPAEDVHQLALANLDGEYATVVTTAQVLAALAP